MTTIATLQDLMVHQLRDLYSAEKQLVQALPKMLDKTTSTDLQDAIHGHLRETEEQVKRLEQAFDHLGESSKGTKCKAMEGLIDEAKDLFDEDIDPDVLDAGIIACAQRVEHYEIAGYGTVCEFARALGHQQVVTLLEATLTEEKDANRTLTKLAEGGINQLAMHGGVAANDGTDMDEDGANARMTDKTEARTSDSTTRTKVGPRRP